MRNMLIAGTLIVAVACGDGTGPSARPGLYVHAATGNDANNGSSSAPFKTITKALSVADSGDTVRVLPGRYDATLGEQFPLAVGAWVTLVGDETHKGGGATPTLIFGGGPTSSGTFNGAIESGIHATIAGFTVTDSAAVSNPAGIVVENDGVTIRNNRLINSTRWGIVAADSSVGGLISNNVIMGNQLGVLFTGGGVSSRVESNTITANVYGLYYEGGTGGDLGGGTTVSSGGNTLSCNSQKDIFTENPTTVDATGNKWDHVPPTTGATGDIDGVGGTSTVITTGATLAAAPCL